MVSSSAPTECSHRRHCSPQTMILSWIVPRHGSPCGRPTRFVHSDGQRRRRYGGGRLFGGARQVLLSNESHDSIDDRARRAIEEEFQAYESNQVDSKEMSALSERMHLLAKKEKQWDEIKEMFANLEILSGTLTPHSIEISRTRLKFISRT